MLVLAGLSGSALRESVGSDAHSSEAPPVHVPVIAGPEVLPPGDGPQALALPAVPDAAYTPDVMAGESFSVAQKPPPSTDGMASDSSGFVPLGVQGSWRLVFDEEFNALDPVVWTPYWFRDCHPESKKNNVKTCSRNVKIAAGEAILQVSDAESGALLSTNPRDGVRGHSGFEYSTGYAEARIYFPGTCSGGIYNWPAWWTVGQSYPHTGEIDIAEPLQGDMTSVYHAPNYHRAQWVFGCWAGQYHTYGVNRMAGRNDVYFDGRLTFSYETKDGNAPHYLLLNLGTAAGPKVFGQAGAVRVDYVRVWQQK